MRTYAASGSINYSAILEDNLAELLKFKVHTPAILLLSRNTPSGAQETYIKIKMSWPVCFSMVGLPTEGTRI